MNVNTEAIVNEVRARLTQDKEVHKDMPAGQQALFVAMDIAQRYGRNGAERKQITQQVIHMAAEKSIELEKQAWELAETELERGVDKLIARAAKEDTAMAQSAAGCLSCCLHIIRARRDLRKQRAAASAAPTAPDMAR
jgi:hypothetical protein